LSRVSGVKQPGNSQFVSDRTDLSDDRRDQLLSCMGYRLEVVRRSYKVELSRAEERSWRLHRQLARGLPSATWPDWEPVVLSNLDKVRAGVRVNYTCAMSGGGLPTSRKTTSANYGQQ